VTYSESRPARSMPKVSKKWFPSFRGWSRCVPTTSSSGWAPANISAVWSGGGDDARGSLAPGVRAAQEDRGPDDRFGLKLDGEICALSAAAAGEGVRRAVQIYGRAGIAQPSSRSGTRDFFMRVLYQLRLLLRYNAGGPDQQLTISKVTVA
jgi:hypothetical protein